MKIILISGKAHHGKDTLAEMLNQDLKLAEKRVIIAHYGDLLKYVCKTFYNWDGNKDEDGRHLLQHVGTDIVRNHDPNYWCDFLTYWAHIIKNDYDFMIIPDVRFQNEINAFNDFNTTTIRVVRQGRDVNTLIDEVASNHVSETTLDTYANWDYTIVNTSGDMGRFRNSAYLLSKELIEE